MRLHRSLALAGAMAASALAACRDVPLVPRWDADWLFPLSSGAIRLGGVFSGGYAAPGDSQPVSFPWLAQPLDRTIGDLLAHTDTTPGRTRNVFAATIGKTIPIAVQDTLFVVRDTLSGSPGDLAFPMPIAAADAIRTDSTVLSTAQLDQLRALASGGQPVFIRLSGQATNPGPGGITIASTDSIGVRLTMTVRVAVSGAR